MKSEFLKKCCRETQNLGWSLSLAAYLSIHTYVYLGGGGSKVLFFPNFTNHTFRPKLDIQPPLEYTGMESFGRPPNNRFLRIVHCDVTYYVNGHIFTSGF